MPRSRAPRARKSRPRRRPARRARKSRIPRQMPAIAGKGQYATCIETHDLGVLLSNAGQLNTFTLSQFPRAQQMAALFSWYKAVKVTYSYEPLYNTFQESVGAPIGKPYILTMMNRTQEVLTANYPSLLRAGARPLTLTNKHVVTYRPNWCTPGLPAVDANFSTGDFINYTTMGLTKSFNWLTTPPTVTGSQLWQPVNVY